MSEPSGDAHGGGALVGLATARARLLDAVELLDRTERLAVAAADGRVLAEPVDAGRSVPHYRRAAMDGFAVRAADTAGATRDSPASLRLARGAVEPGTAVPVATGGELPAGADAVVRVERADAADGTLDVSVPVETGKDVAPVGEDVRAGQRLYEPGHCLRPSDLGLLTSVGRSHVEVVARPRVRLVPTGGELVRDDPSAGEVVETNALTVARYVERWGGRPDVGDPVDDDREALSGAIRAAASADVVVTTGGSSVGETDLVPAVLAELGALRVHGVAIKPGHPVAAGRVDGTPVLALPGYPVSAIVTAVQLLRPALGAVSRRPLPAHPTTNARLSAAIDGEPGVTSFARVRLAGTADERVATPVESAGAGVLSSVALADGWVVVPPGVDAVPAGETVAVEDWEPPR